MLKQLKEGDIIVCTDGSFDGNVLSYSFCIFDKVDCRLPLMEFKALLTPRKTILDAEATALICGLDAALAFPFAGSIFLLSDCRAALRILLDSSTTGPLSYIPEYPSQETRPNKETRIHGLGQRPHRTPGQRFGSEGYYAFGSEGY